MKLELKKGWNLVSLVRDAANPTLAGVFGTSGDIQKVYNYGGGWEAAFCDGTSWTGTLTSIEDGKGYWVYSKKDYLDDKRLEIPLKPIDPLELPPSYDLEPEWNMVGYTNLETVPDPSGVLVDSYMFSLNKNGIPIWVSAYFYDEGYTLVKPSSTNVITPGDACWIYLTESGTLVP